MADELKKAKINGIGPAEDDQDLESTFPSPSRLFRPYKVEAVTSENVIVAFDTSVLLLPYRISQDDLHAIAGVYKKLGDEKRLFLPARVAREFAKNRERLLAEMIFALNQLKSRLPNVDRNISPSLVGIEGYAQLVKAHENLAAARGEYAKSLDPLIETVRNWRGDDPVSNLYNEVFVESTLIELEEEKSKLSDEWDARLRARRPPGYKDGSKDDAGIGDFLIWKALLLVGERSKKDLIFVTGEEKIDWFVRSGKEPIYPRPELVDEYREHSSGKNLRLCSLYQVLREMNVADKVLQEIKTAETEANTAIREVTSASRYSSGSVKRGLASSRYARGARGGVTFDYSTNDGQLILPFDDTSFALRFSPASSNAIYFYKGPNLRIARIKSPVLGEVIDFSALETSSNSYRIGSGEAFAAENADGAAIVGVIEFIESEAHGGKGDRVSFRYMIDRSGQAVIP